MAQTGIGKAPKKKPVKKLVVPEVKKKVVKQASKAVRRINRNYKAK